MHTVVFVNEHRSVEVPAGKNLKTLLVELGIDQRAKAFNALTCGVFGACTGCQVWVRTEDVTAPAPPLAWRERWAGMRGERRLSCQVSVGSNLQVITMARGADRLRTARPIAPPPQPTVDPSARRKPIDAAPTAEFVLGHPTAIGTGNRSAPERPAPPNVAVKPKPANVALEPAATGDVTAPLSASSELAPQETERAGEPFDPSQ